MQRLSRALMNAGFFLVCYAPIPLLAGQTIMGNCISPMLALPAILLLSVAISFVPGKVGGSRKSDAAVVKRSARGNDPDPDRALRSEALPDDERRSFPLRALIALIGVLLIAAAVFIRSSGQLPLRIILAGCISVLLPLSLRVVALDESDTVSVLAGVILYGAAGVVGYAVRDEVFNRMIMVFGLAFLAITALNLNVRSMQSGAAVRSGVRPPAGMRRRNRMMLAVMAAIGAAALYFDQIRTTVIQLLQRTGAAIVKALTWLSGLFPSEQSQSSGGSGGETDMLGALGGGESGAFWLVLEKVAFVLAAIIVVALLAAIIKKAGRILRSVAQYIAAYIRKFTDSISEEYHDEQESLFDWGETKKELGETFRKKMERLTKREKKWNQMDERERVRFVVRALYKKAPESGKLRSLTVHEAARMLPLGQAQPEELAEIYDQARYSQKEPSPGQADRLRKEAKV